MNYLKGQKGLHILQPSLGDCHLSHRNAWQVCSSTSWRNPATKHFSLAAHHSFLVTLSSLIYQDFCPFYTNQYPPMSSLTIQCTDQMWQIIHWDQTCQIKTQHQTGTYARGTMESVYWSHRGEKCYNLYMKQNKDKIQGQNIIQKWHKMHNFTLSNLQ